MQVAKATKDNKMGTMPIGKLLATMSVPMMISMLVQALYNVVDSIFVSRISEDALTAVSMVFPIQNLMIAMGVGLGVGLNAQLSRSLGERNLKRVNSTATHGLLLYVAAYLVFLCVGLFAAAPFMNAQINDAQIVSDGISYLRICCILSFGMFMQFAFERMLTAVGKTTLSMLIQLVGAVINIILDPILIFGLLGFPAMGVAGAAIATVAGQIIAAVLGGILNHRFNHDIKLSFRRFTLEKPIIFSILSVGIPSIVMQSIGSVMTFGMNQILVSFSSTAVAVFGAYFKLQSFVFMPVFGLTNGLVPIIAFNYGAQRKQRMLKALKLSQIVAVTIMCIGTLVVQLFPEVLLLLFKASDDMLQIGVPALRTISLGFVFAGISIVFSSFFQALGNGIYSLIMSIARQLIVLLPSAYLLATLGGLNAVWYSFFLAEIISFLLCLVFARHMFNKVVARIPDKVALD